MRRKEANHIEVVKAESGGRLTLTDLSIEDNVLLYEAVLVSGKYKDRKDNIQWANIVRDMFKGRGFITRKLSHAWKKGPYKRGRKIPGSDETVTDFEGVKRYYAAQPKPIHTKELVLRIAEVAYSNPTRFFNRQGGPGISFSFATLVREVPEFQHLKRQQLRQVWSRGPIGEMIPGTNRKVEDLETLKEFYEKYDGKGLGNTRKAAQERKRYVKKIPQQRQGNAAVDQFQTEERRREKVSLSWRK